MEATLSLPGIDIRLRRGACEVRERHFILDPPWRGELALGEAASDFCPCYELTPVLIAGKEQSPDEDAVRLAMRILSSPGAALSPLLRLDWKFSADEWMLSSLSFPYQTFRTCWYASFTTEYDGQLDFAFTVNREGSTRDAVNELWSDPSFASVPPEVLSVVDRLRTLRPARERFEHVLARIDNERLFGTELVRPLLSAIEDSKDQLPEAEYDFLKKKLQGCASLLRGLGPL